MAIYLCTLPTVVASSYKNHLRAVISGSPESHDGSILPKLTHVMIASMQDSRLFFSGTKVECALVPREGGTVDSVTQKIQKGNMFTHHQKSVVVDAADSRYCHFLPDSSGHRSLHASCFSPVKNVLLAWALKVMPKIVV